MDGNIFLDYLIAGELGVLNMIIWGIYGDLQAERFSIFKVFRSLFIGAVSALFLYLVNSSTPLFIVALTTITFERLCTEIYKAFLRDERQGKYLIPSDWNVDWPRSFEKSLGLFIIFIFFFLFAYLNPSFNKLAVTLVAGFVVAIGGAAKDAPYEGLQLKFFRSPAVTLGVGLFLNYLYPDLPGKYYLFSVWGGERIISEFYKKILNGRVPGKFNSHKLNKKWIKVRKILLIPYVVDIGFLGLLLFNLY